MDSDSLNAQDWIRLVATNPGLPESVNFNGWHSAVVFLPMKQVAGIGFALYLIMVLFDASYTYL